jgi:hypothetical protein
VAKSQPALGELHRLKGVFKEVRAAFTQPLAVKGACTDLVVDIPPFHRDEAGLVQKMEEISEPFDMRYMLGENMLEEMQKRQVESAAAFPLCLLGDVVCRQIDMLLSDATRAAPVLLAEFFNFVTNTVPGQECNPLRYLCCGRRNLPILVSFEFRLAHVSIFICYAITATRDMSVLEPSTAAFALKARTFWACLTPLFFQVYVASDYDNKVLVKPRYRSQDLMLIYVAEVSSALWSIVKILSEQQMVEFGTSAFFEKILYGDSMGDTVGERRKFMSRRLLEARRVCEVLAVSERGAAYLYLRDCMPHVLNAPNPPMLPTDHVMIKSTWSFPGAHDPAAMFLCRLSELPINVVSALLGTLSGSPLPVLGGEDFETKFVILKKHLSFKKGTEFIFVAKQESRDDKESKYLALQCKGDYKPLSVIEPGYIYDCLCGNGKWYNVLVIGHAQGAQIPSRASAITIPGRVQIEQSKLWWVLPVHLITGHGTQSRSGAFRVHGNCLRLYTAHPEPVRLENIPMGCVTDLNIGSDGIVFLPAKQEGTLFKRKGTKLPFSSTSSPATPRTVQLQNDGSIHYYSLLLDVAGELAANLRAESTSGGKKGEEAAEMLIEELMLGPLASKKAIKPAAEAFELALRLVQDITSTLRQRKQPVFFVFYNYAPD